MTSITTIIPTYNRATTILRALDSVFAQTYQPDEVIVIDDGSTDNTRNLIKINYPTVKYIYQPNKGVSSARNHAIKKSKNNWIAFLDSDDQWLPEKLEHQIAAIKQDPAIKFTHSNEIWIRNGKRVNQMDKHQKQGGWIFEYCLPLCVISPSSVMMHRSVINEVGLFDESLPACEDYDMWLRVCARYPVHYLEQPLIKKYGGHADQLSRKHWGMDRFRIRALEKIIDSGILSELSLDSATKMLSSKIDIFSTGAKKHGNLPDLVSCQSIKQRLCNESARVRY